MTRPARWSALALAGLLGACAPAVHPRTPATPNPVFAPGQVWEVAWSGGRTPETVEIPPLTRDDGDSLLYRRPVTKTDVGISAFYSAGPDEPPNMELLVTAPGGVRKDCLGLITVPVAVGEVVAGVSALDLGPAVYGTYLRTGDPGTLVPCTMTRHR